MTDDDTPDTEAAYTAGQEATAMLMLGAIIPHLPAEATNGAVAAHHIVEARQELRSVFESRDLLDQWDPELHLADLIRRLDRSL